MVTSKDTFKEIEANFAEFKALGQAWCDTDDKVAAGKARSYSKRVIKAMRLFVELSIKEGEAIKLAPVEQPEVKVDDTQTID